MHMLGFCVLSAVIVGALAGSDGAVSIMINGQQVTKYALSPNGGEHNIHVEGNKITLTGGGRVYIGNYAAGNLTKDCYFDFDLQDDKSNGKRLTYDVDMSQVGCNCNGALYMVSMPAYNSAQNPEPGKDGSFYCDANQVGGTYCPEMDIWEANKYAMASTAHTCNYIAPHYYSSCDRGGCGTNVLEQFQGRYGPGMEIDTNLPMTFSVTFTKGGDNKLARVHNVFMQNGKTIEFDSCNSDYLQWMGYSLPYMVMTMSLWGTPEGGMSWLDGKSGCHGGCNLAGSRVIFSNIRVDNV